ncbi:MAG: hypothetical protein KAS18_10000 [Calditrichia bacterium]|nr:hypothetical protein [Calditrichia bacterium]
MSALFYKLPVKNNKRTTETGGRRMENVNQKLLVFYPIDYSSRLIFFRFSKWLKTANALLVD